MGAVGQPPGVSRQAIIGGTTAEHSRRWQEACPGGDTGAGSDAAPPLNSPSTSLLEVPMTDSQASTSPGAGEQPVIPVPRPPAGAEAQQVRKLFCDQGGHMRDPTGTPRAGRRTRHLSVTVDEATYRAFLTRCHQRDISAVKALQRLIDGGELPPERPVIIPLPAEVDAEALRVLHQVEQRLAAFQAGGRVDIEVAFLRAFVADLGAGHGGPSCPCGGRAQAQQSATDKPA